MFYYTTKIKALLYHKKLQTNLRTHTEEMFPLCEEKQDSLLLAFVAALWAYENLHLGGLTLEPKVKINLLTAIHYQWIN